MTATRRILIVEDTEVHLDLMQYELRDRYDLDFAKDTQAALQHLEDNHYDLVILDQNLPPHDQQRARSEEGLRILQAIKAKQRQHSSNEGQVKIVIVSSYLKADDVAQAQESGVERIFEKPFSLNEFREYIDQLWSGDAPNPTA